MYRNFTRNFCMPLGYKQMFLTVKNYLSNGSVKNYLEELNLGLAMKITTLLLIVSIIQVSAASFAQKVSISKKNISLEDALKQIHVQSGYDILYDVDLLKDKPSINLSLKQVSIEEAMKTTLHGQSLTYALKGMTIILQKRTAPAFLDIVVDRFVNIDVTGRVTDKDGAPIPGVTVNVKNRSAATSTNSDGKFGITVDQGEILVFRMIGYDIQEVTVGTQSLMNITLVESNSGLDEVVVIGYGTQKKRDLTGAISSVKSEDLVISSGPEIGNMLKGKVAGLTIRQNSAQPGGGVDIQVRGYGSVETGNVPLYVVDGFPISDLQQPPTVGGRYEGGTQSILNSFNPNDIESIEVLKDASATAIYGSRAANGVILITTKRGAEGKTKVDYANNFTIQQYNDSFDVLPLNEWMQVRNEAGREQWEFDNGVIPYGTRTLADALASPVNGLYKNLYTQNAINNVGKGTDWLELVTRNGFTQQHNLSTSGGSKTTKYLISGNYYDQDGIIKNSGFKRFSLRANVDQEISKYIKLGLNLTTSRIDNNNSQLGGQQFENSGIIRAAIQQGPHIQAIDEDGNYPLNPQLALQPNPYSLLTISDKGRIERMLLNSFVDITPLEGLVVRLKAGMDRGFTKRESYIPTTTLNGALEGGRAFIGNTDNDDYLLEATANYTKTLGSDHRFDILAGVSQQKTLNRNSNSSSTGFITDAFLWNNLGAATNPLAPGSGASEVMIASYFGRFNYNYKGRYLFTFTTRTDGSSVFAVNNKWGTFPSAAVAWNVAEEPFFKSLKNVVSQFKIRLGYGQTGKASINTNAFAAYGTYPAWLSGDDARLIGVSLSRLENPDLKWETTTGANFGIDYSILGGKVEGSFELFDNEVSDLLDFKDLNSYHEVNTIIYNVGTTKSKGFEFSVTTRNIRTDNFQWKTTLNISRFKDNWKERAPDWKPLVYESDSDPIRAVYSRLSDGILQVGETVPVSQPELKPGMIKIKDINGYVRDANNNPAVDANGRFLRTGSPDGIIDDADTKLVGTSDPSMMAGITNILSYKRFSLNFDFNGLFGRTMADPNYVTYGFSAYGVYSNGYNALRTVKERWTPQNPSTTTPSSFWGFSPYSVGDFFMQDAWFVRLQNVSLGYSLPTKWTRGAFSSIRAHVDAQNLFTITPYKGVDPETDSYTAAYPNIRTFTAGLNFTF
ncbi:TonB-dependent receptor [Pedobacter psychroterrae]|uniref:SusC/RagA family TonB-linked outer membrane protein n=1 Tax=Pedobacter psychroterrae TaxID=2530453 RepID=A0A4R0NMM1_9SPHI|nr:TonB-dependent receptor [Pedobacter psychroterrae]TCD00504.1 SusC/RagA family TonB-linked outer membrane protein [Pedobacter psychroterrae]